MKDLTFVGTDVNLTISLFEQGMIAAHTTKDYADEYFVVYRQGDRRYGTGWKRESELDALIKGKEWANKKDIEGFLSFAGTTKADFLAESFVNKLSPMLSYWGFENIIGMDYNPITEAEAEERYLS